MSATTNTTMTIKFFGDRGYVFLSVIFEQQSTKVSITDNCLLPTDKSQFGKSICVGGNSFSYVILTEEGIDFGNEVSGSGGDSNVEFKFTFPSPVFAEALLLASQYCRASLDGEQDEQIPFPDFPEHPDLKIVRE